MDIKNASVIVTGGASGLGRATAQRLIDAGANVVVVDLASSHGEAVAAQLGPAAIFAPADVRDTESVQAAIAVATDMAPLRALVHCAGRGGPVRLVERDGEPGSLDTYLDIVTTNLVGTFNVMRLVAATMARQEPLNGERGVCILTASVAAYEGQIGQIPYAASKAGIVGMTLVAARDLASKLIRVATIAPGLFDTPLLARLPEKVRDSLGASVPHPSRLGHPDEYASLAMHMIENPMINGETIRLDGAIRMAPR